MKALLYRVGAELCVQVCLHILSPEGNMWADDSRTPDALPGGKGFASLWPICIRTL